MPIRSVIRHVQSGQWLTFADPVDVLEAAAPADAAGVIDQAERRCRDQGLYALGFVTYEAAPGLAPELSAHPPGILPPAWFALYRRPESRQRPAASGWTPAPLDWQADLGHDDYLAAIRRIREHLVRGDTYQVNFSYRLRAALDQAGLSEAGSGLFEQMIAAQPDGYGALLETDAWGLASASPELFLARRLAADGARVVSQPMKGTAARGPEAVSDRAQARWLGDSTKNRAENLMITDMVRNDIGRLAVTGSVRTEALFQLQRHPTLWQMTSTVSGRCDAPLVDLLRALFPAASITGAPKRHTMRIIRELESSPREIYTGTIGLIEPDGAAQFNVAIRTAWLDKRRGVAEYGVGGGIVWDSDPEEEHAETLTKARIVRQPARPSFALLETLLWEPDAGFLLAEEHLTRLGEAASYFDRSFDPVAARRCLDQRAAAWRQSAAGAQRVRLLVQPDGSIDLEAAGVNARPAPARVALVPAPVLDDPFVYHKTTHRAVYQQALEQARIRDPAADDAILVNERGEVTESTIANVVADIGGELVTPPRECGLLNGIYRQHLVATGAVKERVLTPDALRRARTLYLVNSVRRRWPITLLPRTGD